MRLLEIPYGKNFPGGALKDIRNYGYDSFGRLNELTHKNLDKILDSFLCEYDSTGNKIAVSRQSSTNAYRNYLWQSDTFIGLPEEGIHVLTDFFHSPVRLTDKAGTTQNIYQYDEFGGVTQKEEALPIPFAFTGYVKEPWEELYYTGNRAYNAKNGRFQSKDQYRYMDYQDPLSMNLYQYVKGNPLHYLDFDGHESIERDFEVAQLICIQNYRVVRVARILFWNLEECFRI